jgi:hypothetical protein
VAKGRERALDLIDRRRDQVSAGWHAAAADRPAGGGAKTDISMDWRLSFIPKGAVTSAAAQGGGMLRAVIDKTTAASDVWADTAYR